MSKRTSEASKAIREAWELERQLVIDGQGTRDWTPMQQQSIIDKGKAYDDDGKAFEGHHMKSAELFPEYQGDAKNIQFLSRSEHKAAHGGSFKNPTNGYYNPSTGETHSFGIEKYKPCIKVSLSEPVTSNSTSANTISNSIPLNKTEYTDKSKRNVTAKSVNHEPIQNEKKKAESIDSEKAKFAGNCEQLILDSENRARTTSNHDPKNLPPAKEAFQRRASKYKTSSSEMKENSSNNRTQHIKFSGQSQ